MGKTGGANITDILWRYLNRIPKYTYSEVIVIIIKKQERSKLTLLLCFHTLQLRLSAMYNSC